MVPKKSCLKPELLPEPRCGGRKEQGRNYPIFLSSHPPGSCWYLCLARVPTAYRCFGVHRTTSPDISEGGEPSQPVCK